MSEPLTECLAVGFAPFRDSDYKHNEPIIVDLVEDTVIANPHAPDVIFTSQLDTLRWSGVCRECVNDRTNAFLHLGVATLVQPVRGFGRHADAILVHARPTRAFKVFQGTVGRGSLRASATAFRSAISSRRAISLST